MKRNWIAKLRHCVLTLIIKTFAFVMYRVFDVRWILLIDDIDKDKYCGCGARTGNDEKLERIYCECHKYVHGDWE